MQTLQRARNVLRLNSQISQNGTFVHYLFFVLNIPLFTFSYRYFFPLFVCFDILWQLATTHERDNTRDRDANSSRQNDFTWCDFLQGKQVKLLLSRSLLPQKRQKLYRSRFSLVKNLSSTCRQVYNIANAVLRVKNVFAILPCNSAFHMTKITIMENVNSAIFTIFVHCFRKQPS